MNHLYEKVSYLRGLADGLDIEGNSKEGKILLQIIDTLEEFTDVLLDIKENQDEINEYVEAIDEDLADMEDELFLEDEGCCTGCGEEFTTED